ncbi:hypothetical protein [Novosphingobium sp. BL-52-GroH]|uniref:hypothetical protein n=1 Tax=Novosphingobium sp. BL-52-GroH TaxID=3349877 RepID=UPI00384B545C
MAVSRKIRLAGVMIALVLSTPVLADDPHDPTMTPEAAARDRETIRRLNRAQLDYVRKRDAGYAQGWRDHAATRDVRDDDDDAPASDLRDYAAARADYARQRRQYDRAMAEWRQDVDACRAGYYDRCDRR